ncbi:MAG: M28 family peptidase, partial [Deltaproteobacteria bacterium]|nr:M28 family peptidase [Deltaproteobacteria bacterium]
MADRGEAPEKRNFPIRLFSRRSLYRIGALVLVLVVAGVWGWACMVRMPGQSHQGPLAPLPDEQEPLAAALEADVTHLTSFGPRNVNDPKSMDQSVAWLEAQLGKAGLTTERHTFVLNQLDCHNVVADHLGTDRPKEIVLVGAHYDSVPACVGANDNASGVAVLLALARALTPVKTARTIRFVAFANEEPPHFQKEGMGSWAYALDCQQRGDDIVAMLSLETMGYYSDQEGSQSYPFPMSVFYPSTGNFIAFVGNVESRHLVRQAVESFRKHAAFPAEGAALPGAIPGVGWSDHWSFWQAGYPGIMVTDTAPFRYPHYHEVEDTPD